MQLQGIYKVSGACQDRTRTGNGNYANYAILTYIHTIRPHTLTHTHTHTHTHTPFVHTHTHTYMYTHIPLIHIDHSRQPLTFSERSQRLYLRSWGLCPCPESTFTLYCTGCRKTRQIPSPGIDPRCHQERATRTFCVQTVGHAGICWRI